MKTPHCSRTEHLTDFFKSLTRKREIQLFMESYPRLQTDIRLNTKPFNALPANA